MSPYALLTTCIHITVLIRNQLFLFSNEYSYSLKNGVSSMHEYHSWKCIFDWRSMSEGVFGRCIFNRIACSHKVSQTIQAEVERLVAAEAEVQCEIGDKMHDFMFLLFVKDASDIFSAKWNQGVYLVSLWASFHFRLHAIFGLRTLYAKHEIVRQYTLCCWLWRYTRNRWLVGTPPGLRCSSQHQLMSTSWRRWLR